jgi:hypothetical protein
MMLLLLLMMMMITKLSIADYTKLSVSLGTISLQVSRDDESRWHGGDISLRLY